MFKFVWKFFKSLERWENSEPSSFWFSSVVLYFSFSTIFAFFAPTPELSYKSRELAYQSQIVVQELRAGAAGDKKGIDLDFHRRLEKYFPDWEERMAYQEKQTEFYKLAMKRKREIRRMRVIDEPKYYNEQELDAINYFAGKGYYEWAQNPKTVFNIHDTRQSFLLKMHDTAARERFLKSFNRRNN